MVEMSGDGIISTTVSFDPSRLMSISFVSWSNSQSRRQLRTHPVVGKAVYLSFADSSSCRGFEAFFDPRNEGKEKREVRRGQRTMNEGNHLFVFTAKYAFTNCLFLLFVITMMLDFITPYSLHIPTSRPNRAPNVLHCRCEGEFAGVNARTGNGVFPPKDEVRRNE